MGKWLVLLSHFLILSFSQQLYAQGGVSQIKKKAAAYFASYSNPAISSNTPVKLSDVKIDTRRRIVTIAANAAFSEQPFTPETVRRIRGEVARLLPPPYNTYQLSILAGKSPLEELIPQSYNENANEQRQWVTREYKGNPWVAPMSLPYDISHGLKGRHIALWASHGRYYDPNKGMWRWQRPQLYCTTEDIFTQSFVVPFLMPMLENAGAVVFTPRERDWQRNEVIVDNDFDLRNGTYTEVNGSHGWQAAGVGFSQVQDIYFDGENPFLKGTCRMADTQTGNKNLSRIVWQPQIPADGRYAVYVSYKTLPTSVSDAEYTVRHRGIETKYRVNQQMGGSTWVYLGTFDFEAGQSANNCVVLSNQSNYKGTVTADAVRFGGGMGNVARGDSLHAFVRSGLPRYLECSRYYAQWAGMPFELYKNKETVNDYAEDINTRSLMTNKMARGSVYLPGDSGLCVPIDMSLAIHSDAGFRPDSTIIGTLGIYTSGKNTPGDYEGALAQGLLGSGLSRMMSRDFCDMVMNQVVRDIRVTFGTWNRRQMYDRNYSETRMPEVPSMILETMSHQNFFDMCRGHDPLFKMFLSRSIYKGILEYTATAHDCKPLIAQPMPVMDFAAEVNQRGDSVTLSWTPQSDPADPYIIPTGYVIYTSVGNKGYDNGQRCYKTRVTLPLKRGQLTRYQVRAQNEGGVSMESEELCVYSPHMMRNRMLIVNAFDRLAGPQPVENDSLRGFDFDIDPGVVYHHSASYCGRQYNMLRGSGENFGQSNSDFEGMLIAGNTFDFPTQHARDFLNVDTTLCISSTSRTAFEKGRITCGYNAIDLIFGAQRYDGYSTWSHATFTPTLMSIMQNFTHDGGSLLVSGAYIGEDVNPIFASSILHFTSDGSYALTDSTANVQGMNTRFSLYASPNEQRYSTRRISVLLPTADAFCTATAGGIPLAVAHQGSNHRTLTYGFPLECIRETETRRAIMAASLRYVLNK